MFCRVHKMSRTAQGLWKGSEGLELRGDAMRKDRLSKGLEDYNDGNRPAHHDRENSRNKRRSPPVSALLRP